MVFRKTHAKNARAFTHNEYEKKKIRGRIRHCNTVKSIIRKTTYARDAEKSNWLMDTNDVFLRFHLFIFIFFPTEEVITKVDNDRIVGVWLCEVVCHLSMNEINKPPPRRQRVHTRTLTRARTPHSANATKCIIQCSFPKASSE